MLVNKKNNTASQNASIIFLSAILIFFYFPAFSQNIFKTPYVSFTIGEGWICKSFGVDWICRHYLHEGAKPALIIVTAKQGEKTDSIDMYTKMLKDKLKNFQGAQIKKISVKRHIWVDSFSKNSIINNFFSRHIATVCCSGLDNKIHILIGFYSHQELWTKYANEFLKSIKSLSLTKNIREILAQIRNQTDEEKKQMLSYIEKVLFEDELGPKPNRNNKSRRLLWLIAAVLLTGAGFYLLSFKKTFLRKRRKRVKRL